MSEDQRQRSIVTQAAFKVASPVVQAIIMKSEATIDGNTAATLLDMIAEKLFPRMWEGFSLGSEPTATAYAAPAVKAGIQQPKKLALPASNGFAFIDGVIDDISTRGKAYIISINGQKVSTFNENEDEQRRVRQLYALKDAGQEVRLYWKPSKDGKYKNLADDPRSPE